MKKNRVCLAAGYKYEYDGAGRNWAASSDEKIMAEREEAERKAKRRKKS